MLIGGHPRSGTTLLWRLCNHRPDVTVTLEFTNLCNLGEPYAAYRHLLFEKLWSKGILRNRLLFAPGSNKGWRRWVSLLRNHAFVARYLFGMHSYRRERIGAAAVEATLRSIFPKTRIVGDKYPDYVFSLDKLVAARGLSCLIIYRNCRDVTSSTLKMVRTDWRNQPWVRDVDTAEKVAKLWVRAIELMERHRDKIHIIRYEGLVQEPERVFEDLGKWLGVDPADFPKKLVKDTGIGKHRNGLSDGELETIMEIAGPTMRRLGYI